jgi:hypothetical protein
LVSRQHLKRKLQARLGTRVAKELIDETAAMLEARFEDILNDVEQFRKNENAIRRLNGLRPKSIASKRHNQSSEKEGEPLHWHGPNASSNGPKGVHIESKTDAPEAT